jgi:ribonuclease D
MIINSIKEALKTNKNLPSYQNKNGSVLKVQEQKRVKILKDWKNKKAFELKIDPSLVLNRNFIAAISIINPRTKKDLEKIKEAKKWQIKEFGKEILSVLKNADQEKLWKKE